MKPQRLAHLLIVILLLQLTTPILYAQLPGLETQKISCTVHIAAVSSSGKGVLGNLTVTIEYPGTGKVYISTSPAAELDTQGSARTAAFVASLYAGVPMWNYNFYYDIESPSVIIGGPSAGAEMTLATLLLLTGHKCNDTVVATGMIQPDGSIGPVGGLKEKLEAVAESGAKIFVVPAGQTTYTYYTEKIRRVGPFVYVTREPVTIDLYQYGQQLGVTVYSAATIIDLYNIALNGHPPTYNQNTPVWRTPDNTIQYLKQVYQSLKDQLDTELNQIQNTQQLSQLIQAANQYEENAQNYYASGDYYRALAVLGQALIAGWTAKDTDTALSNGLDVTETVSQINQSIIEVYNQIQKIEQLGISNTSQLYKTMRAYALMGLAAYYYTSALQQLQQAQDHYYLPHNILTGVNIRPLILLENARWYTTLSSIWLNMTSEPSEPINATLVERSSILLESNAKTMLAYTTTLLQEVGVSDDNVSIAAYLLDQAMSTEDPIERLGLSIYSIVVLNAVIQETFPMQTQQVVSELLYVLSDRQQPASELEAILLGQAINTTGTTSLRYASELVLVDSMLRMVSSNNSTPLIVEPETTSSQQYQEQSSQNEASENTVSTTYYAQLIIIALTLAVLLYALRIAPTRPSP
ncbi:MAG: hypothetical protein F7C36_07705 [Desulfurococcales archaeon]|nr:hypothetical protein [Desulfurococcales archaeon]